MQSISRLLPEEEIPEVVDEILFPVPPHQGSGQTFVITSPRASLIDPYHKIIDNINNVSESYRKIRLIESNAKCRYLKKLTCKGTLRQ